MNGKEKIHDFMVTFFYLALGTAGTSGVFLSVIRSDLFLPAYILLMAAACVLTALIFVLCRPGKAWPVFGMLAVPYLFLWFLEYDRLAGGLTNAMPKLLRHMNKRFNMNLMINIHPEYGIFETTFAFFMVSLPVVILLGYAVRYAGVLLLSLCFLGPLIAALCLDKFPSLVCLVFQIFCFLGVKAGGRKRRDGGGFNLRAAGASAVLVAGSALLAYFLIWPLFGKLDHYYKLMGLSIQETVNEDVVPAFTRLLQRNSLFSPGWSNGELNKTGGFQYVGAEILELTLNRKPTEDIYLKGFIGDIYTGDSWKAQEDEYIQEYYSERGWNTQNSAREIVNLSYHAAEAAAQDNSLKPIVMQIHRLTAPGQCALYPYGAYLTDEKTVHWNGTVEEEKGRVSKYTYYPVQSYYWMGPEDGVEFEPESYIAEKNYQFYVYENYLDCPKEKLPRLTKLCEDFKLTNRWEVIFAVTEYLSKNAKYNINVSEFPEEEDFVEYFLFEQQEGYCIHFASTAVLMFRMLGVPARYVSGYCVPASSFERNKDGKYQTVVKDRQAHAWAEVYLDGIGWIPVETTPGGGGAGISNFLNKKKNQLLGNIQSNVEKNTGYRDEEEETREKEEQKEKPEHSTGNEIQLQKAQTDQWRKTVFIIAVVIVAMLLLFICVLAVNSVVRRNRHRRSFMLADRRECIRNIFVIMYEALLDAGFPPNIDVSSQKFIEEISVWCTEVDQESFALFMEDVSQCNFGNKEPDEEAVLRAQSLYKTICCQLYENLPLKKKLHFRFWKAY